MIIISNTKTHQQGQKIFRYLPPVKDALGLRTPGIYSIPCECGKVDKAVNPSNSVSKSTIDT
jgi:hypothetical protein